VCDEAGGFVGLFQRVRAGIRLDGGLLLFGRTRTAGGFLQARISSICKARLSGKLIDTGNSELARPTWHACASIATIEGCRQPSNLAISRR
jgi:hypothetical protein